MRNRDVQDPVSKEIKEVDDAPLLDSAKLPIQHPDYRYPPSRNPYWAKLNALRGRVFHDNDTETHRGKWRDAFPDATKFAPGGSPRRELQVEIGCNAGHVILEWAAQNPKNAYIGLDWKFKAIFRGVDKAQRRGIDNLVFFRAHAERLPYMFGPGEIDRLALYFPDPWPKKAHWKNRFITSERLKELAPLIREGGIFHIKTDHEGYFRWMEKAVADATIEWDVIEKLEDMHRGNANAVKLTFPDVTLFERLFIKDGLPIYSMTLKRRPSRA